METTGVCRVLLVICLALAANQAIAEKHEVTWDPSTDLDSWSSGETFKVGDQLEFKYPSGFHSVIELSSEKEYKNCDTGNAVNSMNDGNDVVKLTKSGTRYFACGTAGHCGQGMKLKVKTVSADGTPAQDSSSSPSATTTSPSTGTTTPSSSTSAAASSGFVAATTVAALGIVTASFMFNILV